MDNKCREVNLNVNDIMKKIKISEIDSIISNSKETSIEELMNLIFLSIEKLSLIGNNLSDIISSSLNVNDQVSTDKLVVISDVFNNEIYSLEKSNYIINELLCLEQSFYEKVKIKL